MLENSRYRAGDPTFHIDRATTVHFAAGNFAGKWRILPCFFVARRHHVGVTREYQIGPVGTDAGVKIFHGVVAGFSKRHAMNGEASLLEQAFKERQRSAFDRRDCPAAQELAGNDDGLDGTCPSQSRNSCLMLVLGRLRSSTGLTMTAQYNPGPPFLPGSMPGTTTE